MTSILEVRNAKVRPGELFPPHIQMYVLLSTT